MPPLPDGSGRNSGDLSGCAVLAVAFAVFFVLVGLVLIIAVTIGIPR